MGKKGKVGKQRKDNYYKLAKQKGFRSRAAFKLIQLNRKFEFLENSRVCIDLCAAPGGWLQVASEYMPVSSVIIGVDLVPIAPIRNVITFQSDITTKECSTRIESNLSGWTADVVLHDGAPNVGKNWLHDAYSQNCLVVKALKIACSHLKKGGWFITKIFRSADYNSLLWVFGKLFGKVHATKPQASRQESAEIFVVCQNFRKPEAIDPKFFDPSALFADISNFDETLKKQKADLLKPAAKVKKPRAQGYEDGDIRKFISDVEFVTSNSHMDYLASCHKIILTNEDILKHESTDQEIKDCCDDLKVLGRKELLRLLKWRRNLRKDLTAKLMKALKERNHDNETDGTGEDDAYDQLTLHSDDEDAETVPELQLDDIEAQQDLEKKKESKRLKRKEEKKLKDYQQRLNYGMINEGDVLIEEENDLFNLNRISGKKQLTAIDDVEPEEMVEAVEDLNDKSENIGKKRAQRVSFAREADVQYFELDKDYDSDEEHHPSDDIEIVKQDEPKIKAPKGVLKDNSAKEALKRLGSKNNAGGGLLTDLLDISQSKVAAASRFFDKDTFNDINLERDFETDIVNQIAKDRPRETKDDNDEDQSRTSKLDLSRFDDGLSSDDSDNSDSDSDEEDQSKSRKKKQVKLDPEGLALATMMIGSDKIRQDIEDEGWNRYAHADTHLAPKWFREEEEKYCRRNIPVRSELVKEYKQKLRDIDAKPIKKVLQAKARKKRRAMRKMEKVRKKVEAITSNDDITQKERINQIKTVYKNASKTKKKEVKLVVQKKGLPTKKPVKGKYKTVDSRLKKDLRAKQRRETKGKRGHSGGAKGRSGPSGSRKKRTSNNSMESRPSRGGRGGGRGGKSSGRGGKSRRK